MNNDETLTKQAGLLTALASAGDDLKTALKVQSPNMAALAVKRLFAAVDALRATVPTPVYVANPGDVVWALATVEQINAYGRDGALKLRFGKGEADYAYVDASETPVRLADAGELVTP